jgi:hypothetical protein
VTAPNTESAPDSGSDPGSDSVAASGSAPGSGPRLSKQLPEPQAPDPQVPEPELPEPPAPPRSRRYDLRTELLIGVALVGGAAVLGLLMGLLWHLVAPKVPLYADTQAIYLLDPEGEQAISADMYFAMLGAGFGLLVGALAYWRSRAREGGVTVVVGLVLGGLLGSWIAMKLGVAMGPGSNIVATAKSVALGRTFYAPLTLTAKAMLLAWPAAALIALTVLTSLFTPRPAPTPIEWGNELKDRSDTL